MKSSRPVHQQFTVILFLSLFMTCNLGYSDAHHLVDSSDSADDERVTTKQPNISDIRNSTSVSDTTTESTTIPSFTSDEDTKTFSCNGRVTGYYADVKLDCRVYHFCSQIEDPVNGTRYERVSYLCLQDSYFDQNDLNCVKKSDMKVSCDQAEKEYERSNKQFDPKENEAPSMSDNLAANIMMNPIARFITGR